MFENYHVLDITPVVSTKLGVFPGDVKFSRNESMSTKSGDHISLSSITTTLHLGAHTDAPVHYHQDGESIEQRKLDSYLGECQVVEVDIERGKRISVSDIDLSTVTSSRVLFKTNSFPNPDNWNSDFNSLSPELVEELSKKGVKLIGIDTPSVDPEDAKELLSHLCIYKHDISILEGVVLKNIDEGLYQLIALPLPIKDADASPVRAVLLKEKNENN